MSFNAKKFNMKAKGGSAKGKSAGSLVDRGQKEALKAGATVKARKEKKRAEKEAHQRSFGYTPNEAAEEPTKGKKTQGWVRPGSKPEEPEKRSHSLSSVRSVDDKMSTPKSGSSVFPNQKRVKKEGLAMKILGPGGPPSPPAAAPKRKADGDAKAAKKAKRAKAEAAARRRAEAEAEAESGSDDEDEEEEEEEEESSDDDDDDADDGGGGGGGGKTPLPEARGSVGGVPKKYLPPAACSLAEDALSEEEEADGLMIANDASLTSAERARKLFAWLIAPMSVDAFYASHWEKKPLLIKRGARKAGYFDGWFSKAELGRIVREGELEFGAAIDLTKYEKGVRHTLNPDGVAEEGSVWRHYEAGCSIRLLRPQRHSAPLWQLLSVLEEEWGSMAGANVYLTPKGSQGFAPHYDDIEAFIMQVGRGLG